MNSFIKYHVDVRKVHIQLHIEWPKQSNAFQTTTTHRIVPVDEDAFNHKHHRKLSTYHHFVSI